MLDRPTDSASPAHAASPATQVTSSHVSEGVGVRNEDREGSLEISVVVPVFNEQDSLQQLREELVEALAGLCSSWEVLFVDDGSTDGSREVEASICQEDSRFSAVQLRQNFGKTAALSTGFQHVKGAIVVTMDADLQDVAAELPKLVEPIRRDECDLMSGWKWPRLDPWTKTLPSKVYNAVTRWATGLSLHDMNCGFKAYRRDVVSELRLSGDLHRYIPVMASDCGWRVDEVKVTHRARQHGVSKYRASRFVYGFVDLLTVLLITRFRHKPLHLLSSGGGGLLALGLLTLTYLSAWKWVTGLGIGTRPLFYFGLLCVVLGAQCLSFGFLAELLAHRARSGQQDYPTHAVLGVIKGAEEGAPEGVECVDDAVLEASDREATKI